MKYLQFLLAASLICATGCLSTHEITYEQCEFNALNKELEGEVGKIVLHDDNFYYSENIRISQDTSYWVETASNKLYSSPTWKIKRYPSCLPGLGCSGTGGWGSWYCLWLW